MEIRKAALADLPRMMEIYAGAREYMRANGNPNQWVGGYPSEDRIREDIAAGESWLCVENGEILSSQVVDTNGHGHGALTGFLQAQGVDTLICGGIGGGAQMALAEAGIQLYGGVCGDADDAVQALLSGDLEYNPCVRCSHHDHHDHACGDHGCGSHTCH